jgi:hypothetical protein
MPLDAYKIQHVLQVVARSFSGRQQTVVLVVRTNSGYSYSTLQAILRAQQANDPQVSAPNGNRADTWLIAPIGTNLAGVVYVADTTTATSGAIAAAPKYEIIEVLTSGLIPGGSHLRVALRRLH